MPEPTPEQVRAHIRYSVSYQAARHPTTFPEVGAAAVRLVNAEPFESFVLDVARRAMPRARQGVEMPGVQAQPYAPPHHDGPEPKK